MIPKKIHYCWFGKSEKTKLMKKCIKSWSKVFPDFEIIEWNESNFDVMQHPYLRYCYENKKYAFLSDLVRLLIIEQYGGIYFDVDVEAVKDFGDVLNSGAFYGFENNEYINTGLGFGAEPHHYSVKAMIDEYNQLQADINGNYPTVPCPASNTRALEKYGLVRNGQNQKVKDIQVLSPIEVNPFNDATGILNDSNQILTINWYGKSWMNRRDVIRSRLTRPFHRLFGENCFRWLKNYE